MTTALAILIGCLYTAGFYMMLRRSLFKLILGLVLLSHGANLLIFTAGGLKSGQPPVLMPDGTPPRLPMADPLPQALILTAIVIGFGVLAFALVLFHRSRQVLGTDDPDSLRLGDR
jgi:multicomponent Na+:H+ antiporter subunit C